MTQTEAIAWIDEPAPAGRWGPAAELHLPLDDRGLLLADGIFETVLVLDGRPRLLADHLRRWQESAALLGMEPPPPPGQVEPLIEEAIRRSAITTGALRLNWSRGSPPDPGARGLAIPAGCRHRFWLQLSATSPCFEPVRVIVSPTETRNATSLLSRAKTFAYGSAIQARREAAAAGADDALLRSSAGDLCCGTSASLLVRRRGEWFTPPLSSGCLPGVMRGRGLALELVREERLSVGDLPGCEGALLLNSLGYRPIRQCDSNALRIAGGLEDLWKHLLSSS